MVFAICISWLLWTSRKFGYHIDSKANSQNSIYECIDDMPIYKAHVWLQTNLLPYVASDLYCKDRQKNTICNPCQAFDNQESLIQFFAITSCDIGDDK